MSLRPRLWGLNPKAIIFGLIIFFALWFAFDIFTGILFWGVPDLVWIITGFIIVFISLFIGGIIAGKRAPLAGIANGSAVGGIAWILLIILTLAIGNMESAARSIEGFYWILVYIAVGGSGGKIGIRWAEKKMSEQQWIERGNEYSKKGAIHKAIECYDKTLKINPSNSLALQLKTSTSSQFEKTMEQEREISGERYGSFAVNKFYNLKPNVQYAFIFLKDRIVAVTIGGQWAQGAHADKIKEIQNMPIKDILRKEKSFEIPYSTILKVEVKKTTLGKAGQRAGVIKIFGQDKQDYNIAFGQKFDECVNIIRSAIPTKLEVKD
jgi:tetratricopeptide (TPR) repeat protein